jgi:hypothetical protein
MPAAKNPRFVLTLSERNYEVLKALADLRGVSMSAVVNQMVAEARPVLRSLLALAKEDPRQADMVELLECIEDRADRTLREASSDLRKRVAGKRPRGSR